MKQIKKNYLKYSWKIVFTLFTDRTCSTVHTRWDIETTLKIYLLKVFAKGTWRNLMSNLAKEIAYIYHHIPACLMASSKWVKMWQIGEEGQDQVSMQLIYT